MSTRTVRIFGIFLLLVMAFGCTQNNEGSDPKFRLTEYVSRSFSIKRIEDRAKLSSLLTGEVKARLDSWSEDQFREAFIDSKRQFQKLLIKEIKMISPSEAQITYELTYTD